MIFGDDVGGAGGQVLVAITAQRSSDFITLHAAVPPLASSGLGSLSAFWPLGLLVAGASLVLMPASGEVL